MVYEYIISCKFRIRDQLFISFIIYFLFLIIGLNLFHPKIIIIITKTIIYLCFCWRNGAVLCSHGLFEGLTQLYWVCQVTSPHGTNYHSGDHVESGNFAFTAAESGDYTACLQTPDHSPQATVTVEFDWRIGVAARDWPKVVKKGQIEVSSILYSLTLQAYLYG